MKKEQFDAIFDLNDQAIKQEKDKAMARKPKASGAVVINESLITSISGAANKAIVDAIVKFLPKYAEQYGINTPLRLAHFLGQTAHESGGFRAITENLNYSADALQRVFPRHFRVVDANKFHRNPEMIANHVYSNRMGNGNYQSGDGWRFRGRGLIQLTGRDNYTAFGRSKGMSPEQVAEYATTPEGAIEVSTWFWNTNGLNQLSDRDDINSVTRRINGGTNGLDDRIKYTNISKRILKV
jgi:putative chitinase